MRRDAHDPGPDLRARTARLHGGTTGAAAQSVGEPTVRMPVFAKRVRAGERLPADLASRPSALSFIVARQKALVATVSAMAMVKAPVSSTPRMA